MLHNDLRFARGPSHRAVAPRDDLACDLLVAGGGGPPHGRPGATACYTVTGTAPRRDPHRPLVDPVHPRASPRHGGPPAPPPPPVAKWDQYADARALSEWCQVWKARGATDALDTGAMQQAAGSTRGPDSQRAPASNARVPAAGAGSLTSVRQERSSRCGTHDPSSRYNDLRFARGPSHKAVAPRDDLACDLLVAGCGGQPHGRPGATACYTVTGTAPRHDPHTAS
jgi:hypothetical protein